MKIKEQLESGKSQSRFGTTLFLFKLAGIPLGSRPVIKLQSAYNAISAVSYYITCVSCFMDLYSNRNDLEQFMRTIRLCFSMIFVCVCDIFFRYECMKLKTTFFDYIRINFKNVASNFSFLYTLLRLDMLFPCLQTVYPYLAC
jgi:hypothetical protein